MTLKRIIKNLKREYKRIRDKYSNIHYLSIGENCLTQDILRRHQLKSFSTPYSNGRSNLDYAISLEKEKYSNLLKPEHLFYDYIGELKVVRNKHYSNPDNIYNEQHQNSFEFTHHDVINNGTHKKSLERKILRMKTFSKREKLKFLYHYRYSDNIDFNLIIKKAEEFLSYYKKRNIKCELTFFTQEIVSKKEERILTKIHDSNNVRGYVLKTLEVWQGNNDDVFWARNDDDLIKKMIREIK